MTSTFWPSHREAGQANQPSTGTTPEHVGYAIVTIPSRGLPQDGADLHVTPARLEALGRAFSAGDTILNNRGMEHFAVADRPVN